MPRTSLMKKQMHYAAVLGVSYSPCSCRYDNNMELPLLMLFGHTIVAPFSVLMPQVSAKITTRLLPPYLAF